MQRYYTLIYNSLKMLLKNEKSLSVRQEKNSQVNHNYRRKSYATIKNEVWLPLVLRQMLRNVP